MKKEEDAGPKPIVVLTVCHGGRSDSSEAFSGWRNFQRDIRWPGNFPVSTPIYMDQGNVVPGGSRVFDLASSVSITEPGCMVYMPVL